jgi:hypothetical protein
LEWNGRKEIKEAFVSHLFDMKNGRGTSKRNESCHETSMLQQGAPG